MKETTGEVSMTVVTIVLVGIILALGTWLFVGENAPGKRWVVNMFEGIADNAPTEGNFGDAGAVDVD